ncbi:MAG: hypothetical protein WA705_31595 [Candidatus Ozemobacteraceae bacterium]
MPSTLKWQEEVLRYPKPKIMRLCDNDGFEGMLSMLFEFGESPKPDVMLMRFFNAFALFTLLCLAGKKVNTRRFSFVLFV